MEQAPVKEKQAKDATEDVVMEVRNVSKGFPGVQALANVNHSGCARTKLLGWWVKMGRENRPY